MRFYLGTHMPNWLWDKRLTDIPLFVSHRRLKRYKTLKPAVTRWALDSGGFTELSMFGEWRTPPSEYIAAIRRYANEIGNLDWASPQDWMCEPHMIKRTGKTVRLHQMLTTNNYLELVWQAPDLPIIPVLQGWTRDDYLWHAEHYESFGIDLAQEPVVGLGSVCRRQHTAEAADITNALHPIKIHAFGAKGDAIALYGSQLTSCDSMAWSFNGRYDRNRTCPKKSCSNCLHYALAWRDKALRPATPSLFTATEGT